MSAPNIQTSNNPQYVSGGEMGAVVGYSPTTNLGFYGETGTTQQTVAAVASDAATTLALANSLRAALVALGLVV
jgi:hypothetical protein